MLRPVLTLADVHGALSFVGVKRLIARPNSNGVGCGVQTKNELQDYAAEYGVTTWLKRSAVRFAEKVVELECQLRAAPVEDRAALEDSLRTWRQSLVIVSRDLERSPGVVRRRAVRSSRDVSQFHLRLVE